MIRQLRRCVNHWVGRFAVCSWSRRPDWRGSWGWRRGWSRTRVASARTLSSGFRPCAFATVTGRLCPTCGMTTSFAWFMRGRIDRSWQANPAGCLFALLTVPLIAWLVVSAVENEPVGFRSLSGPFDRLAGCGRRSQPRVLVDSIDRFARRSGRAGSRDSRPRPGRPACELPRKEGVKDDPSISRV